MAMVGVGLPGTHLQQQHHYHQRIHSDQHANTHKQHPHLSNPDCTQTNTSPGSSVKVLTATSYVRPLRRQGNPGSRPNPQVSPSGWSARMPARHPTVSAPPSA